MCNVWYQITVWFSSYDSDSMRKTFKKIRPRVINYRSYRDFSNETFRVSLINNLSNEVYGNNDDELENFLQNNHGYLN